MIGQLVSADRDRVAAMIVRAIGVLTSSPSSTRRRMASERVATSCCSRHESIAISMGSCQRMLSCVPLPVVAGRPRFFFVVPLIDLLIEKGSGIANIAGAIESLHPFCLGEKHDRRGRAVRRPKFREVWTYRAQSAPPGDKQGAHVHRRWYVRTAAKYFLQEC